MDQLSLNSILGVTGVAILGLLATAWDRSRGLFLKLFAFAFREVNIDSTWSLHSLVAKWKPALTTTIRYKFYHFYIASRSRSELVLIQGIAPGLYWKGFVPIWISENKQSGESTTTYTFRYIRGLIDLEAEIVKIFRACSDRPPLSRVIYSYGSQGDRKSDNSDEMQQSPADFKYVSHAKEEVLQQKDPQLLSLSDEHEGVVKEILNWSTSRDWCLERDIPWKRGYLLSGPPGTGKTSFVRFMAAKLRVPIHAWDLGSSTNADLDKFRSRLGSGLKILLLEDLDAVFNGRENVSNKGSLDSGVTFDCLLQVLDGVEGNDGVLLFITTNHPERLDPAIRESRAGRIDRVLQFGMLDYARAHQIASRVLKGLEEGPGLDQLASTGVGLSPANFQEVCFRHALALKYGTPIVEALPERPSMTNGHSHLKVDEVQLN